MVKSELEYPPDIIGPNVHESQCPFIVCEYRAADPELVGQLTA